LTYLSLVIRHCRHPTPFPYTTLFRSEVRAIGEESRIGDSLRNRREAVERLREIPSLVMLEGLPNHPPPVRPGRKLVRTKIDDGRSEEHTSELQSHLNLVCRLLLEKKK